jgi:imidazolonepropionase-like amidohydrolase
VGSGEPRRGASSGSVRHVDLAGRTILPGFIDCHVHLTMRAEAAPTPIVSPMDQMVALMHASINALNTLHGGVTTVRDCGAPHAIDFALRRAAEDGLCLTPRLLLSGRALCMTGGHGWHLIGREVDGADQVRRAAREQLKAGADNKNADLVVVDGNPMEDVAALRAHEKIRRVVLNGQTVLDRDASRFLVGAGFSPARDSAL